jgi:HK97 family phage major capsid protein
VDPLFAPATGATALDTIAGAIGQLQAAGYSVDGLVMNGADAARMRLLKNANEDYLWARPTSTLGTSAVWSLPLVISPSMAAGSFLVGAFSQASVVYSRQMLTVNIAYENEDDFLRNLACFRAEERLALAIPVPTGLVKGTLPAPVTAAASSRK